MDKESEQYKKYQRYINSPEFKTLKIELIQSRGMACENCGKKFRNPVALQTHHVTYDRLYNEEPDDLLLLCGKCHQVQHGLLKPKRSKKKKPVKKAAPKFKLSKKDSKLQSRYDSLKQSGKLK